MTKYIETTGKTMDDAVRAALEQLGLTEEDISYEILTLPKSGFLGIGSVPAKIRVSYESNEPEPTPVEAKKPMAEKKPANQEKAPAKAKDKEKVPAKEKAPKKDAPKAAAPEAGSREEKVYSFLKGLMEKMEVECEVSITTREDGGMDVKLEGPNMGAAIGRRGETLDAIQHLVNYTVNRNYDKHTHINVDAEDYRSKREESLVRLAEKMAAKAIKYKRSMALEPMNSYERHIIHTALQNYEGVTTSSTGTEPNRRVVVNYVRPEGEPAEESRHSARRSQRPTEAKKPAAPAAEPVKEEKLPADYPVDYEPPMKNKPQSREWC